MKKISLAIMMMATVALLAPAAILPAAATNGSTGGGGQVCSWTLVPLEAPLISDSVLGFFVGALFFTIWVPVYVCYVPVSVY